MIGNQNYIEYLFGFETESYFSRQPRQFHPKNILKMYSYCEKRAINSMRTKIFYLSGNFMHMRGLYRLSKIRTQSLQKQLLPLPFVGAHPPCKYLKLECTSQSR